MVNVPSPVLVKSLAEPEVVVVKDGPMPPSVAAKAAKGAYDVDEHLLTVPELLKRYKVNVDVAHPGHSKGLSKVEVEELRRKWGRNALTPPKTTPVWLQFLNQFTNPLMMLLLVAGALAFMAYGVQKPRDTNNAILGAALIIVVTITCTMSFIQERSAGNVMDSLKRLMPARCSVYRDGMENKVDASELVPGDVVRLGIGDRVPADIRIIATADLKVECSSLTGESDLIPATVDRQHDIAAEAHNIVFMSSLCMSGEAYGVVVRTGDNTFIGCISSLATDTNTTMSSLQVEVHRLVYFVAAVAFSTAIIFFIIGLARKKLDPLTAFVNGFILVIVANVPEGLPATVTSCLTLTAQRLRDKNVLIKRTDIVENLGCASVIASDKTGTLTQNKMTVEHLWVNCELHPAGIFQPPPPVAASGLEKISSRLDRYSRAAAASGHKAVGTLERLSRVSRPLAKPSRPMDLLYGRSMAEVAAANASSRRNSLADGATSYAVGDDSPLIVGHPSNIAKASRPLAILSGRFRSNPVDEGLGFGSGRLSAVGSTSTREFRMAQGPGTNIPWQQLSSLDRLVAVALVCNKARFEGEVIEEDAPSPRAVALPASPKAPAVNDNGLGVLTEGQQVVRPMVRESRKRSVDVPVFVGSAADRTILGDATDSGLLRYCDRMVPATYLRRRFRTLFSIPFNSTNKWALTVTECPGQPNQHLVLMKGAPEILINKCSGYYHNGQEKTIDDDFLSSMNRAYERCGMMGERVLGFAYKVVAAQDVATYATDEGAPPTEGLNFLGLISLVDPPRDGVQAAVHKCRTAGIRVMMVTGDHPLTAEAIARKVGIVTLQTPREVAAEDGVEEAQIELSDPRVGAVIVTGAQLRELTTVEEWDEVLDHEEVVFARTSPQQKLEIVENLQRRGEVVAVTGDGVNDSPALKRAQIGVAMGRGGSDVAREAADIILLNDDFTSIVLAIEEGRVIFDNLKKTIAYTLTHAVPEVLPIFLNLALSFPLGLGGLMILTIDLLTEQGPAISLAYEHAESSVMDRPPRDIKVDRLIDGRLLRYAYLIAGGLEAGIGVLAYFSIFLYHGIPISKVIFGLDNDHFVNVDGTGLVLSDGKTLTPDRQREIYQEAQSAVYVSLVMCQFWHIFVCKSRQVSIFKHGLFKNPVTVFGLVISITIICLVVYVPALNPIFLSYNLSGIGWLPHLGFLFIILPYTELSKWITRRNPMGWWARNMQW